MPNETPRAEQFHEGADGLRLGGALWVIAGVVCAGLLIFVFVGEDLLGQNPGLSALVLGGAVSALATGGLLLARPSVAVVRWSAILGLAWLLAFGSLWLTTLSGVESGPMLSSSLITGFGVAGALVTFRGGRSARSLV
ncbi:MAG TPA: hypothetical protein VFP22_00785 [Candidatus Limnocylindrales bacterium]|nr:hypothetical protein [Candidatus Limnocylindrales bacterium]